MGIARYRVRPPGTAELPTEREVLAEAERIRAAEEVASFGRRERKKALEVHRFAEQIAFALRGAPRSRPLTVLDGACGKSVLSFVARTLLLPRLGLRARIVGVDESAERITTCRRIARNLGLDEMEFHAGRLADVPLPPRIDVAWALHACGDATDQFLARAVRAHVRYVLCVPCCHPKIGRGFDALGLPASGRLRARVGDALLDSARFLRLEAAGYRVDAVDFAGGEVTPRNLMLRAEKTASGRSPADAAARLARLVELFPELGR
ncbi:MAG: SAM-dependent methyltransferase [Deltaproteobacteria bacterium]|nr:SAM-dependent methyltransferase [Deltaproteobacteria bacterium]